MALVLFTRPDKTKVGINSSEVLTFAPVPPPGSPAAGPLADGTRICFKNGTHQDVTEPVEDVAQKLSAA